MKIHRYSFLSDIPDNIPPGIFTVGLFDGVHSGHALLIQSLLRCSREAGFLPSVWTFCGLNTKTDSDSLYLSEVNSHFLESSGVGALHIMNFSPEIGELSGEEFLDNVLIKRLNARGLVLGSNSRLGRGRSMDAREVLNLAQKRDLKALLVKLVDRDGAIVSSSAIKAAVRSGRLEEASAWLDRPYSLVGTVQRGRGLGTQIGFPTANMALGGLVHPPSGIYSAEVEVDALSGGQLWMYPHRAIAYIGSRPTVESHPCPPRLEVHIRDWQGELEGHWISVRLGPFIRSDRRFNNLEELRVQIAKDLHAVDQNRS
ncbi:MAG: hypothetical protein HQL31_02025 [Planctomycetes bacterium]|nr:hypothetical protein [Planctomycetota bacterium]